MFKTYCRNVIRSFYDAQLYKEAITEWKGFGGLQALFVAAFIGLLTTVMLAVSIYAFNTYDLPYIAEQVPQINIKDHTVVVDVPQPYTISTKAKDFTILIDTKSNEAELYKKKAEMVVGQRALFLRQMGGYKLVPLDNVADLSLNRESVTNFFHNSYFILIVAWPLVALGQCVSLLGMAFIVALLSYVITAPMREEYYFETRLRIAVLAVTPPFIISKTTALFIENALQAPLIKTWFAILLGLLYFFVMIMLIRRLDEPKKA